MNKRIPITSRSHGLIISQARNCIYPVLTYMYPIADMKQFFE